MLSILCAELSNSWRISIIRLRAAAPAIIAAAAIMLIVYALNLLMLIPRFGSTEIIDGAGVIVHFMPDYSVLLLLLVPLVIAYSCWQDATGKGSVFPQTSFSRYLSTLLLSAILTSAALLVSLFMQLLTPVLLPLLQLFSANPLELGYSFTAAFYLQGFLSGLAFLMLVTTAISTLSYLVRSFGIYAVVPILAATIALLLWLSGYLGNAQLAGSIEQLFLSMPFTRSMTSFVASCLAGIVALLVLAALLRLVIPFERSTDAVSWSLAAVYAPWLVLLLLSGVFIYSNSDTYLGPQVSGVSVHAPKSEDAELIFLPQWSMIVILADNIEPPQKQ
jgi:hypothetical protein